MQRSFQWKRVARSAVLGADLVTTLWVKIVGDWRYDAWQLESVVSIDGREYRYLQEHGAEPSERRVALHRQKAAADILEQRRQEVAA